MALEIKRHSKDMIELPDGSIAYSLKRALDEFKYLNPIDYTTEDLLLILLYSQEDQYLVGRIMLFKQIFLIEREVFAEKLFDWSKPDKIFQPLSEFIIKQFGFEWVMGSKFKYGERKIEIYDESNRLTLELDKLETVAFMKHNKADRNPIHTFYIKMHNDDLVVYNKIQNIEDCEYIPYNYGPYSFHVANKLANLIDNGLIYVKGKKNTKDEEFRISQSGKEYIKFKYAALSKDIKSKLQSVRKGLDQDGTEGILKYVYTYYPQYKTRSKIGNKYQKITWGKSKG